MTIKTPQLRFESLVVHGGLETGTCGPTTVPIIQSSAFAYGTASALEDVFRGRKTGPVYTRLGNPTTEALEKRLAFLEGGVAAVATASGMAAIATAVMSIIRSGDEILASASLFGGTFSLFRDTLSNYGITTRFVDPTDVAAIRGGVTDRTRLIFVETIGNPRIDVPDISAIAAAAQEAGIPLVVDATISTPCLARGCDLGADIIVHSTSKYINGTGSTIGGVIIDMGRFGWRNDKFPHFAPFVKRYREFAFTARVRKLIHKDFGACAAPMNSFIRPGTRLEATEITPLPPRAIRGKARLSSPESTSKSAGFWAMRFIIWLMSPLASLTATTLRWAASLSMVGFSMFLPVRPAML